MNKLSFVAILSAASLLASTVHGLSVLRWDPSSKIDLEETCPSGAFDVPLIDRGGDVLSMAGSTNFLSFGENNNLCIGAEKVFVQAGENVGVIDCEDIMNSPDEGVGQPFFVEDKTYRYWLYISKESAESGLEVGVYEGTEDAPPLFWIVSGVEICSDFYN